jgi:hypothetical protein
MPSKVHLLLSHEILLVEESTDQIMRQPGAWVTVTSVANKRALYVASSAIGYVEDSPLGTQGRP